MTNSEAKTAIIEAAKTDAAECEVFSPADRADALDDRMLLDIQQGRHFWPEAVAALGEHDARELYRATVREYLADDLREWVMEADAAEVARALPGTQQSIADALGVSQPTVHGWLEGKGGMNAKNRKKAADLICR